ncbi:MAG: hypothetical protein LBJ94_02280 [Puniceicoccales bacterium]|jgi:hypothetical protein|nr:hypothetical protein [Puniceicoccales bacterium]
MKTGRATTATIEVNGRPCSVKVSPSKIEGQQPQVIISYAPVASRQCQTEFIYDEEHIGEQLGKFSEEITESEINAMCEETFSMGESQKSNLIVNGQECEVRVSPGGNQQVYVSILHVPPGSQEGQQVYEFIHRRGEPLAEHIAKVSKKALEIDEFKKTVTSIVNYHNQPIEREKINAQMKEIGEMLEGVRTFAQQNPVSGADISILEAALDALASASNLKRKDGKTHAISDCKDIPACRNVASRIEGLKLLLDGKANGVCDIVAPIAERLHQPIAQGQVDAQMGEIEKMLEEVRTFVQQNPVSEAGMSILKAALGALASTPNLKRKDGKIHAISDCKGIPVCRSVALQIEGLKLLLDAKANRVGNIVAPIVECLYQPIAQDRIDARMMEIGTMLKGLRIAVRRSRVSEANIPTLKAALGALASIPNLRREDGKTHAIKGCKDIPVCRSVALQIEGLKLLLDGKANGIDSVVAPIVERLHQPIVEGQVGARMEEIEKMLEGVRVAVQQNRVPEAGMSVLKAALDKLVKNKEMIQLPNSNFSINDCKDNFPSCSKVASQIEGLKLLLNGKIAATTRQSVEHAQRRMAAEMASECFNASGKIDLGKARELRNRIKPPAVLPEKFSTIPGASLMLAQISCVLDNLINYSRRAGSLREIIDRASELSPGDHGRQILDIMGNDLESPVKPGEAILISLFSLHRQTGLPSCTINSMINADLRNHPERIAKILEQILAGSIFNLPSKYPIHQQQIMGREGGGYIPADLTMGNEIKRDEIFAQENSCNYLAAGIERDSNNPYGLLIPVRNLVDVLFVNFFQASKFGNRHLVTKGGQHGTMFIYHGVKSERDTYSELEISVAGAGFEAGMERLKGAAEEQKVRGMHYMRITTTSTIGAHAENIDIDALLKLDLDALEVGKTHIIGDRNWINRKGHPKFLAIVKTIDPSTNIPTYSFQTVSSGKPMEKEDISRFDVYQPL